MIIVEEHHEIFPVWLRSLKEGRPLTLLHVDAHGDLQPGCFATDLRHLPKRDDEWLQRTVRSEFHFDDFILPAVYLGLFDRIIWLRPEPLFGNQTFVLQKYVRSWQQEGKQLILGNGHSGSDTNSDTKHFTLEVKTLNTDVPFGNIDVLDIEYDFFYCVQSPCIAERIEITEEEYRRYESDRYHFARLHFRTKTECSDGRFFLVFYPWNKNLPGMLEPDEQTLLLSVHQFCDRIEAVCPSPKLLTLCRARHSGYCPEPNSSLIEKILLERMIQNT